MHQTDLAMTRTLINPDNAYLLVLIETVGWHQVRALRNVLVHYIKSKTDIEIYIPTVYTRKQPKMEPDNQDKDWLCHL